MICDNLDGVRPETLHDLIKLRIGHVHVVKTARGLEKLPGSIAFGKMDQGEFKAFFDKAAAFITTEVVPGLKREDLDRRLGELLGETAA